MPRAYLFTVLIWMVLLQNTGLSRAAPSPAGRVYYARFQIHTENGMITKSVLEMLPVTDEFRMEGFQKVCMQGIASGMGEIDPESEAIHNAISKVLIQHGLQSINSYRRMYNTVSDDAVTVTYEGVVHLPVRIVPNRPKQQNGWYCIEAEIRFAPIAFPTRWSSLYARHIMQETADRISLFLYKTFLKKLF